MKEKLNCVLLIDDDEPTNFLNEMVVKQVKCTEKVQIAEGGQEALDFLKSTEDGLYPQPELIFLDINMPGMSGWDFLDYYHELPAAQKGGIVMVMLTTSLNPDDKAKAESLGYVDSFVNKPLTAEVLEGILKRNFPDKF